MCEHHRNVDRVHGDPLQRGCTLAELKPYVQAIEAYIKHRSGRRAVSVIETSWKRVQSECAEFMEGVARGRPHNPHERRAAQIVVDLGKDHPPMELAVHLMALGYWYEDQPRRWASERGFQFQVARLARKLARGETRYSWRVDGAMARSSSTRCPVRVTEHLWNYLSDTGFVGYGVQICREVAKAAALKQQDTISDLREILGPLSSVAKGEAA